MKILVSGGDISSSWSWRIRRLRRIFLWLEDFPPCYNIIVLIGKHESLLRSQSWWASVFCLVRHGLVLWGDDCLHMLYVSPLKYRFFQKCSSQWRQLPRRERNLRRENHLSAQNKLIKESIKSVMHARDERAGADGLRFFPWTSTSLPCSWNRRTASARLPSAFSTPWAASVPASRTWTPRQSWTRPPPRSVTTREDLIHVASHRIHFML